MTKMTYVKALEIAIEGMADGEAKEKLIALKAQQEKKNSADRKPTKTQKENEGLKDDIHCYLKTVDEATASDVAKEFDISNQKASAMLKALVDSGLVEKFEGAKRRSYFKAKIA